MNFGACASVQVPLQILTTKRQGISLFFAVEMKMQKKGWRVQPFLFVCEVEFGFPKLQNLL